jgi:hypothetical protein
MDEEKKPPAVITSDTENRTKVQPKDAPPDKRPLFRRLRAYNTGLWNGPKRENKEAIFHQDNLQRYDAISSFLELTDYQKARGRKFLKQIDLSDTGRSLDVIAFSICVIAANMDYPNGKRYWPDPNWSGNGGLFEEIADDLGISQKEQQSTIQIVRNRLELNDG